MKPIPWLICLVITVSCGVNGPSGVTGNQASSSGWYASEDVFSGDPFPMGEDRDQLFLHRLFLKVDADSFHLLGSEMHYHFKRTPDSDTLGSIQINNSQGLLIWDNGKIKMVRDNHTPILYAYRPDLRYWAKNVYNPIQVEEHVERYTVADILAGVYIQEHTSNNVVFTTSGLVEGLAGYRAFRVVPDFNKWHRYKGKSLLFLTTIRQREQPFEWELDNQSLTLRKYIPETAYLDGVMWTGDYLVPEGAEYRLIVDQSE